ncbi:uncharacterized protein LOC142554215 isoform X2 [Primulina tabacum]|uniref:uncharacterized protein LOC142554215 isoform X2 n=1 Tax=Primulina tabacum TaxID=48773 RepID=UPI003F5ACD14
MMRSSFITLFIVLLTSSMKEVDFFARSCFFFFSVNNPKKAAPTLNETFLGLLYPTENYKVYGYLTNTKVKFILVTTDLDVCDADVRNFFRRFHTAYFDVVSNPFHVPGKKITSKIFAERVSTIVKSFGTSAAG